MRRRVSVEALPNAPIAFPKTFISGDIFRVRAMRPDAVMIEKLFHAADLAHAVQRALAAAIS